MKYTEYTAKDFVMDEFFKKWVVKPTPELGSFWESWLLQHPEKKAEIEKARQIILLINFKSDEPSIEEFNKSWERINREIEAWQEQTLAPEAIPLPRPAKESKAIPLNSFRPWQKIAAVFIGFILAASVVFLLHRQNGNKEYITGFGESRTIILPDSSIVTLNANSTLIIASNWNQADSREVWLKGEAFFNVRKKTTSQGKVKFIVHTNNLNVEVVGTSFNVNYRRGKTKVVLSSGKVQLNSTRLNEKLSMEPGEMAELADNDKKIVKKTVNPTFYTSWRQNKLVFEKTTLQEIALLLEDNYGLVVEFKDKALAKEKMSGEVIIDNADDLLNIIAESLNIKITKQKHRATLEYK